MKAQANLSTIDKNYRYKVVATTEDEDEIYLLDVEYRIRGCFLYRLNWRTTQKLYKVTVEQLEQVASSISMNVTMGVNPFTYATMVFGGLAFTPILGELTNTYKVPLPEQWRYVVAIIVIFLGFLGPIWSAKSRRKKMAQYINLSELEVVKAKVVPMHLIKRHRGFLVSQLTGWFSILFMGPLLYISSNNLIGLAIMLLGIILTMSNRFAFVDGAYMLEIIDEPTETEVSG